MPGQPETFKKLNILTIDRNGMTLNGDLKINGYPSEIVTKYAKVNSSTEYPDFYISIGAQGTKDDYVGHYIENGSDYIFVTNDNKDKLGIVPGTTIAYDIDASKWEETEPDRTPGQYIWQWTRTFKYEWIDTGSLATSYWSYSYTDKVVCLTGATGESAVSYWLKISTPIHTGVNQSNDITADAYFKVGERGQDMEDDTAVLEYS